MRNNQPVVDVEIKFPDDPNAKIISVTDTHGIITDVNQTFIDMCGFSREELIGHLLFSIRRATLGQGSGNRRAVALYHHICWLARKSTKMVGAPTIDTRIVISP